MRLPLLSTPDSDSLYFQISKTVPKKVCDGGAGGGNFGDYDYGNYDNGGNNFGGNFNSGGGNFPRTRNENEDAEVFSFSDKQVKQDKEVNLKSGDAVNFG